MTNGIASFTATVLGDIDIDDVDVELNLSHVELGDLKITLVPPLGPSRRLPHRARPGPCSTAPLSSPPRSLASP